VVDASSGVPIPGALVIVGDNGPRALTNIQGQFTIFGAPRGTYRLRAQRFGYQPLDQTVNIDQSTPPLALRLIPEPLELEELTVTGSREADITGIVRDAATGRPLAWVDLTLTRDAVRQVGRRENSNLEGLFKIDDRQVGTYLLRVEKVGYVSQYVPIRHTAEAAPVEISLEVDATLAAGLAVVNGEFENRVASFPRDTKEFDAQALREAPNISARDFLLNAHVLGTGSCTGLQTLRYCVFIDDSPSVAPLTSYSPRDFYRIDVFYCTGTAGPQGSTATGRIPVIFAYTNEYMNQLARRPRVPAAVLC
jgi:hypothetical protein